MAQMTCYDPNGVAHTMESVDVREYIKSGHYTMEPPSAPAAVVEVAADTKQELVSSAVPEALLIEPSVPAAVAKGKPGPKPKA